jgi:predicted transcriptional regulator
MQCKGKFMKSASIPSLRVDPELRHAAESVLLQGETLSSFVEQSIRASIERRRLHGEFIARGLASRDEAKQSGQYYSPEEIHNEIDGLLRNAEEKARQPGGQ